uniref:Ras-associating domain-containing protein n=1 Tax=Romanomermis culicivorax TaxID=13658 RepID=A0A915ICJ0_ROMCU
MSEQSRTIAEEYHSHELKIYLHKFNNDRFLVIDFPKRQTTSELIATVLKNLSQPANDDYILLEIMGTSDGQTCKERKMDRDEYPVMVKLLWPRSLPTGPDETTTLTEYRLDYAEYSKISEQSGA